VSDYVTDTYALVWHLNSSSRIGGSAKQPFELADQGLALIYVPAIVCVELVFLAERGRIPSQLVSHAFGLISLPSGGYVLSPLDIKVLPSVSAVPRTLVPEMPDRLIVSTSLALRLPLITNDHVIRSANVVSVVW
jgi:PIN domain nuclease of toxin-antitoxin system